MMKMGLKMWFWKVNKASPMYEKMKFSARKLRSSNNCKDKQNTSTVDSVFTLFLIMLVKSSS